MLQGTTKEVFIQPDITVVGLDVEPVSGLINVEFADSSILRLDKCGKVINSIYYPKYDSKLESSWYLSKSDLIVSVFQGDGFEKILLHRLKIGMTKQIHLDFTDKIVFHSACELQDGILLGFDKKLMMITTEDHNAKEVWQSAADEVLLSVEMENEKIYLLKEEPISREKGILPEYLVFDKNESDYILAEKKTGVTC